MGVQVHIYTYIFFFFFLICPRRGNCKKASLGLVCEIGLRCRTYYVLCGSVLSVWTKVEGVLASVSGTNVKMQIVRLRTEDGQRIVGESFFFYSFGSSCENKENQILVFFIFLHNILECLFQWWGKVSFLFLKGWTEVELLDVCSWLRLKFWCSDALPAVLLLPPSLPVDLCAGCLVWRRRILWRLSLCIRAMWDYGTQSHCAQRLDWSHAGSKGDRLATPTSPSVTGFHFPAIHPVTVLALSHALCFFCNNLSLYHGLPAGQSQSLSILLIIRYFWLSDFNWISCHLLKIKKMDFYLLYFFFYLL